MWTNVKYTGVLCSHSIMVDGIALAERSPKREVI